MIYPPAWRDSFSQADQRWLISGPPQDQSGVDFKLWRFALSAMRPGATIVPQLVATLPNASEGLAVRAGSAIVVIDGDQSKKRRPKRCSVDASHTTRTVR